MPGHLTVVTGCSTMGAGIPLDMRSPTVRPRHPAGHAVTYCATSPSLCVLEKLVHTQDPDLLPALVMVRYAVPDDLGTETILVPDLPDSWRLKESWTQ